MIRATLVSSTLTLAAVFVGAPALAQTPDIAAIEQRMNTLQQELTALRQQLAVVRHAQSSEEGAGENQIAVGDGSSIQHVPVQNRLSRPDAADIIERSRTAGATALCGNHANNRSTVVGSPNDRTTLGPVSSVELRSTTGSGQATLRLSAENHFGCRTSNENEVRAVSQILTASASAPFGSGAERVDLATLDGFANDFRLKIGFVHRDFGFIDRTAEIQATVAAALEACVTPSKRFSECNDELNEMGRSAFIRSYTPRFDFSAIDNAGFQSGYALGINASLAYDDFKFINLDTAMPVETSRVGFGVGGSGSLIWPRAGRSLTLGYEYQRAYKNRPNRAFCPLAPEGGAAFITCSIGPGGEPARTNRSLLSLEFRQRFASFNNGIFGGAAIAPQFTYNLEEDRFGIDVPLYLVADANGGLTGGLRFGYISEDEDEEEDEEFILGIFVGVPFSIFN